MRIQLKKHNENIFVRIKRIAIFLITYLSILNNKINNFPLYDILHVTTRE